MLSRSIPRINQYGVYWCSRLALRLGGGTIALPQITISDTRHYIIVANHARIQDPFFVMAALPFSIVKKLLPIKFMTASRYYFGVQRPFAFSAGCFPTKQRYDGDRVPAGVDGAVSLLKKRCSVLIFPEGKRTNKRLPARTGLERIIAACNRQNIDITLICAHIRWTGRRFRASYQLMKPDALSSQDIIDRIYEL